MLIKGDICFRCSQGTDLDVQNCSSVLPNFEVVVARRHDLHGGAARLGRNGVGHSRLHHSDDSFDELMQCRTPRMLSEWTIFWK